MRIVTGSDNGLLKLVQVEKDLLLGAWGEQKAEEQIDQLFRFDSAPDAMESLYLTKRSNMVQHFNIENGSIIQQIRLPDLTSKLPHRFTGLYRYSEYNEGSIMSSNNFGDVHILPFDHLEELGQQPAPTITFNVGNDNESVQVNIHDEKQVAAGGEDQPVALWDVETQKRFWFSKNLRSNDVGLAPKRWVRALTFLPNHPNAIVATTSYAEVRLYDTRKQRRPECSVAIGKKPLVSVCPTPDGNFVLTGDTLGNLSLFDLRKQKSLGTFKGKTVGSIRGISVHPTEPLVACVSLDRHLRVFDYNTRSMKMKMYLKQRMNVCSFFKETALDEDEETWEQLPEAEALDGTESEESDDSGSDLEEIEPKKAKKRKFAGAEASPAKRARKR